jgi:hypothetical protein
MALLETRGNSLANATTAGSQGITDRCERRLVACAAQLSVASGRK